MKSVNKIEFRAELVHEYSMVPESIPLGNFKCSMELFTPDGTLKDGSGEIEWLANPDTEEEWFCGNIGVNWNCNLELIDYDGVFSLPKEAAELLRKSGISVGIEFKN